MFIVIIDTVNLYYSAKLLEAVKKDNFKVMYVLTLFCSSQLLLLHRSFYEDLCIIPSMASQTAQVDRLLEICERVFPSFSIYSPFMDTSRRQSVQVHIHTCTQTYAHTHTHTHTHTTRMRRVLPEIVCKYTTLSNSEYSTLKTVYLLMI